MRRVIAVLFVMALMVAATITPAFAQQQRGLVNVNIEDTTIQVPIAVAANLCDVNVNVLAVQLREGSAQCDATADADAEA